MCTLNFICDRNLATFKITFAFMIAVAVEMFVSLLITNQDDLLAVNMSPAC